LSPAAQANPIAPPEQKSVLSAVQPTGTGPPLLPPLPPLPPDEPPPLLELVVHALWQYCVSHWLICWMGPVQLESCAFEAHDWARLWLKTPPGHSQLSRSLHPLSTLASEGPHWPSMHEMQAVLLPLVSRHELTPPLLLPPLPPLPDEPPPLPLELPGPPSL
jgi:hypothetical protein